MDITASFAARAVEAVRAVAAEEILPRFQRVAAERKDDGSIVTAADHAAQDALVRRLAQLGPEPVLAEEMPAATQRSVFGRGGRFWCVDPLDGSKNFSEGVPFFAVSVALMEDARPVLGLVYDPIAGEAFVATRGGGALLNGRALRVPALGPALAGAVADVSLRRDTARLRGKIRRAAPYARRVTRGSSALSWCHLAAARTDVLLHSGQKMWDYAAGALVLQEAGGLASGLTDDDFWSGSPWSRSVIAARTQPLLVEWRDWVREELGGGG